MIENVLAERYATPESKAIWSPEGKIVAERNLWLAVLSAQQELGAKVVIPDGAIEAYKRALTEVNFQSIRERELVLKQDVKARIEEFNALAAQQVIHLGMTSRDLTDNVEQSQVLATLKLIRDRVIAGLARLAERAAEYQSLVMAGRSHNVAGQAITLGKRLAMSGQELLQAYYRLNDLVDRYPLRGIKGAMGTAQDQLDLFEGDTRKLDALEARIAELLGFKVVLDNVGQVYPRSLDFEAVSALAQVAAGPASFAINVRLMAGFELATEGFQEGQVASTAQPHKRNTRTSERIRALKGVLHGHVASADYISGDQWQEGDVSCSVVRRIILPDSCFAIDGILEAFLTVAQDFGAYPAIIERELERFMPFLATTKLLMAAVKQGMGREDAHKVIKQHAVAVALDMQQGATNNTLYARLGRDDRFPLKQADIHALMGHPIEFTGDAQRQVGKFCATVAKIVIDNSDAAAYRPRPLL